VSSVTETQKIAASAPINGENFGSSVAVDGNFLVVGAIGPTTVSSGSAYTYTCRFGVWGAEQKLAPTDGASGDKFGSSVGISGGTLIVGAHEHDPNSISNAGSAYIYIHNGAVWELESKLVAVDAADFHSFGLAVAIDGGLVAVGAPFDDDSVSNSGSVYVYPV